MRSFSGEVWVTTRDWGIGWCGLFLLYLPTVAIWFTLAHDLGSWESWRVWTAAGISLWANLLALAIATRVREQQIINARLICGAFPGAATLISIALLFLDRLNPATVPGFDVALFQAGTAAASHGAAFYWLPRGYSITSTDANYLRLQFVEMKAFVGPMNLFYIGFFLAGTVGVLKESTGFNFLQLSLFGLIAGVFNLSPIRLHMHLSNLRSSIVACGLVRDDAEDPNSAREGPDDL